MAKMKITNGDFSPISEGRHIFKVVSCDDKYEDFGRVTYEFQISSGKKIIKKYSFVDSKGEVISGTPYYWSCVAKACLNLRSNEEPEVDFSDLVGCYFSADVTHSTYIAKGGNHAGEERVGANIDEKTCKYESGFDGATQEKVAPAMNPSGNDTEDLSDDDLDAYLND